MKKKTTVKAGMVRTGNGIDLMGVSKGSTKERSMAKKSLKQMGSCNCGK